MDRPESGDSAEFLKLVSRRERGKLKVYIGSAAGVGKTYRMLTEAHALKKRGVDVVVGFIETHGRAETAALLEGLESVPTRSIEYRGVTMREMDVDAVIARKPTVVLVDELAHTNVPGSKFRKRWEDVLAIIDAGINVICAVNVQHLESLNDVIQQTLGVTVRETVPDWVISQADQVVNIDLSAEDLRDRLAEGKIYGREKIPAALENFFTAENLTTLRELALREVASSVDRVREAIVRRETGQAPVPRTADRIMVAMSSDPPRTASLLRRASRIAGRLNTDWFCVYVQTPHERADRIDTAIQRRLVDNIQKAQSMGAMVVKLEDPDVPAALKRFAREQGIALLILGASRRTWWQRVRRGSVVDAMINDPGGLDLLIVDSDREEPAAEIP